MEPSIWNNASDDYKSNERRQCAWERIYNATRSKGCTVELKGSWKNYRDLWRKKRCASTGSAEGRKWMFDDIPTVYNLDISGDSIDADSDGGIERPQTANLKLGEPPRKIPRSEENANLSFIALPPLS
ncbi:hypothetical protein COOONC_18399 [Cooperia oncophora]